MHGAPVKRNPAGWLAVLALLAGCDSSTSPQEQAFLIGKWEITGTDYKLINHVTPASSDYPDDTIHVAKDVAGKGYYIRFSDSNTFVALIPPALGAGKKAMKPAAAAVGAEITGKWSLNGARLTTILPDPSREDGADTLVYTLEKGPASITLLSSEVSEMTDEGLTYSSSTSITYTARKE